MTTQLITPNPDIACRPGYCLEYVRQTFGLPARYGSATEAWDNSASQHPDQNFPAGMWVPIYFSIDIEPNGHIALQVPDGSVYSSSDLTNVPHHHPSIDDLIAYYARWGKMQLTYLGWTEDVAGFPVITTSQEDPLSQAEVSQILIAVQGIVQTERATVVNEVRANTGAVAARLDRGIEISRNQAEDIAAATTARVNDYVGRATSSLAASVQAQSGQPLDVNVLAAQLAPLLNATLIEQFITALRAQINK